MVGHPWAALFLAPLLNSLPHDLCCLGWYLLPMDRSKTQQEGMTWNLSMMKKTRKIQKIHEHFNIMMFFSSKSVTLPATWFQVFVHLPNLSSSGFRKDGSSHTLPGFPKANPPPKSRKPTPPKATPVCYTRARTQRKLRGWTGFVHFVSFHKNHFMKTSKTTWIAVTTKPAQWLHELWNPGWLRETPSYNGWIDLLYLYIQITYTFDIVSSLH